MNDEITETPIGMFVDDPMEYFTEDEGQPDIQDKHPLIRGRKLRVSLLPHHEGLSLPSYQTKLSSGMDLIAANYEPVFLNSMGTIVVIPTGISLEIPAGYEAQIRPRSGLASKNGITVVNTPGTIDADYRGEIKIALINLSGRRFKVERGMRIAQIVLCPVVQAESIEVVDDLSDTDRGNKGFGSTGV